MSDFWQWTFLQIQLLLCFDVVSSCKNFRSKESCFHDFPLHKWQCPKLIRSRLGWSEPVEREEVSTNGKVLWYGNIRRQDFGETLCDTIPAFFARSKTETSCAWWRLSISVLMLVMLAQHDFFKNITFASTSSTISRIPLPDLIYSESILFETVDLTGFSLLFLHVGLFHTLTWTPIDGPNSIAAPVSEPLLGSVVSSCLEAPEFFQVSDESGCASVDHESFLQLHRNTSCKLHICLVLISNIVHCNALSCSFDDLVATTCYLFDFNTCLVHSGNVWIWIQASKVCSLGSAGSLSNCRAHPKKHCLVMSGCKYQIPVQTTTYFWLQLIAFLEVRLFIFNIDFAAYWRDCRPVFVRNLGSMVCKVDMLIINCLFYLV